MAANETLSTLDASIEKLTEFPQIGRVLNKAGLRRLPVPHTPHLVFYRATGEEVEILHVRDGRREPFRG